MTAKLQKFAKSIFNNIGHIININMFLKGRAGESLRSLMCVFSVVGINHSGSRYLAGILLGRKGRLACCRQAAGCQVSPLPLTIKTQGAWNNDR